MARLSLKVLPRSAREELAGWLGDALKVKVRAAPEKGRANAAVEAFLSRQLNCRVQIVAGFTASRKIAEVALDEAELQARLADLLPPAE